ncbi:MAG: DUF4347 domain-containing protein, partial [Novipirellula sp. JB048]
MQPLLRRRLRSVARRELKRRDRRSWNVAALESRLMLAGDASTAVASSMDAAPHEAVHSLVFIDWGVTDRSVLSNVAADAEVVLLSADRDAITQITETLSTRNNISAIHLVSHGDAGRLKLGGAILDASALDARGDELARWSFALTPEADILLYGCEVGAGSGGQALLRSLANLTGADVAASIDLTGAAAQGGNWILEKSIGTIESGLAFEATVLARYKHTLRFTTTLVDVYRFSASDPIRLNAGASLTGDAALQLTSAAKYQAGSAFHATPVSLRESTSFETQFSFEISGGVGAAGADGIAFVLQNSPQGAAAVGGNAGWLGYGGIGNSIAIELDSWQNAWDSYSNEVGLSAGGDVRGQLAQAP